MSYLYRKQRRIASPKLPILKRVYGFAPFVLCRVPCEFILMNCFVLSQHPFLHFLH